MQWALYDDLCKYFQLELLHRILSTYERAVITGQYGPSTFYWKLTKIRTHLPTRVKLNFS